MGFEADRSALEKKFHDEWATWSGMPRVVFDNTRFTPTTGEAYIRYSVEGTGSKQIGTGATPIYRFFGVIFVTAYVPENTGTKDIREYLDTAAAIFRNQPFSDYTFRASYQAEPPYTANGWYKMTIAIPFFRDGAS